MFYFLFLIFIYTFKLSYGYIVLPFNLYNERTKSKTYILDNISGKDFLELTTNKLVSSILIGTPKKRLELYITMDYNLFFIGKGYCESNSISFYEPLESDTFKNKSFYTYPFDDLRNMTLGNDTCSLFDNYNLNSNITLNDVHLMYGSKINILNDVYDKIKVCGVMGLKLHEMSDSYYKPFKPYDFSRSLKENNIGNYTDWSIEFFNDEQKKKNKGYDGFLILGAGDENYLKNIKNIDPEDIIFTYSQYVQNVDEWRLRLKEIYYLDSTGNKTLMKDFIRIEFNFDLDYYFVTKEYFESIKKNFFQKYLDSGICKVQKLKEFYLRYNYISCNNNFKEKSTFPTLHFVHEGYNYIFNLTVDDCFKEIDGQILFLLFYDPWSPDNYKVGKNFLKKYQFIFRADQKNIGFMNLESRNKGNEGNNDDEHKNDSSNNGNSDNTNNSSDSKKLVYIFILLFLLIGIIIGVFVGKKVWDRNRKKRANELIDDDYEYEIPTKKENIN